jgi:hypothetical protein
MLEELRFYFQVSPDRALALGVAILCLLGTIALMANPARLLMEGKSADGVVASVVESSYSDTDGKARIRSTATIRFEAGIAGVIALLFWWVSRSQRTASKSRPSARAGG